MVEEIVDDQSLDGRVLSQDPEGGIDAEQGTTVVIVVGRFERRRPPPTTTTTARSVSRRIRVAVVAGGPLQRARDLARVGPFCARGARSGALRDDARSRSAATAAGRSTGREQQSC